MIVFDEYICAWGFEKYPPGYAMARAARNLPLLDERTIHAVIADSSRDTAVCKAPVEKDPNIPDEPFSREPAMSGVPCDLCLFLTRHGPQPKSPQPRLLP